MNQNDFSEEELEALDEAGLLDDDRQPVPGLFRLDSSHINDTAKCIHQWEVDEELSHTSHWVCCLCGLGKYSPQQPD